MDRLRQQWHESMFEAHLIRSQVNTGQGYQLERACV